ncbi:hypothetical protein [Ornithinimicrobium panacihumi]|uniref:hypothetical protein n=1 Tax=Ornithinimicrobium panacihumi TaxID=2008449 RepID=UPI003F895301
MKRTTLTVTALVLGLTLAGCSTEDDTTAPTTDTTASQDAGSGDDAGASEDAASTDDAGATGAAGDDAGASEDAASTGAAGADAAPMADAVCADYFQTKGVPLSERADKARTALEAGDVGDPASWGEVNLLKQRIERLGEDASGDQAALLERINAPFVETSAAVLENEDVTPSDPEIEVPEIDVTDSRAAQEEFLASCSG